MKRVKKIEKFVSTVMCVDRAPLIRGIRGVKQEIKKGAAAGEIQKRLAALEKRAVRSRETREKRKGSMPPVTYIPELPITGKKEEIIHALKHHRVVIISGETGSGKTTQIPKFCMAAGRGAAGKIGCTQPRRIAAINVAARVAQELGQETGNAVGYKIRFDDKSSRNAVIKVMTDGILLAETQKDPFLNEYDTIIVDEAHERSLNIDFTLGILRSLIRKRPDLTLVITSATIDTEKFSKAFDNAPVIEVSGRMFPVEVRYRPLDNPEESDQDDQGYVEAAARAVDEIQRESRTGDILIFMPTERDIEETIELIQGRGYPGVLALPLFARLSAKDQARVFTRGVGRKIIVSTNVAETSLTIPGIKYVVDSGLARILHYSPRTRTTALPVKPVSQSSANQRMGRCGRVENGICIRLYDEDEFNSRPFFTAPEVLRSNLAEVILRMISLKLGDVASFPFIDAPSPKSIKDGFDTLLELGAITRTQENKRQKAVHRLTGRGRVMAGIPVDPKLSRILIEADKQGCLDEAVTIVSALSIADPRQRPQDKAQHADQMHAAFKDPASDFVTLLNIWKAYQAAERSLRTRGKVRRFCKDNFLSFKRLREWGDIRRQIRSVLKEHRINGENRVALQAGTKGLKSKEFELGGPFYTALHKSFLSGYLANIARKKEKNIYTAAKGQTAVVFPGSSIYGKAGAWIVAAEFVETTKLFARTAATIDPGWLEEIGQDLLTRTWSSPRWEKRRGEVVATEQVSLFGLVIVPERTVAYGRINPQEAGEIFIRHALVEQEVARPFPFMQQNQSLIDELRKMEEKTRKRDIVATEDDIFFFYQQRLDSNFSNLATFSKFLKDRRSDKFLRLTVEDLQKKTLDREELMKFPDTLEMGGGNFKLEYGFQPGKETDGVTVKVPAVSAASVAVGTMERLVPGLFKEKVTALIKALPKKHRVKLVPASAKAEIIAREMPESDRSLFPELSRFVKARFNADIPVPAWSDRDLDDHLKMRISITDAKGKELAASRENNVLQDYATDAGDQDHLFNKARKRLERTEVVSWDFGDISAPVLLGRGQEVSYNVFYGLSSEKDGVSLRLFKSEDEARQSHQNGIQHLYTLCYESDFKALKKDMKRWTGLKKHASQFGGWERFRKSLVNCVIRELFARDIRTGEAFADWAKQQLPTLYSRGEELMKTVVSLCDEHERTAALLKGLILRLQKRPAGLAMAKKLQQDLGSLLPEAFPDLYDFSRIKKMERYVAAIRIRAERGAVEPVKDAAKAVRVDGYTAKLNDMVAGLSRDSSTEKAEAVENFFWMIEEYKVSVFAQELKTLVKISPKRLDAMCHEIRGMI
ncbi:MAG: ATP-dependent RNA helicase HrpA [Desulfobacteraceae bacterium]|nr:ATP-dependent RNA helicase HrpA [Desulfobacteraceae bacterium]